MLARQRNRIETGTDIADGYFIIEEACRSGPASPVLSV